MIHSKIKSITLVDEVFKSHIVLMQVVVLLKLISLLRSNCGFLELIMIVKINIREINILLLRKFSILPIPVLNLSNLWNGGPSDWICSSLAITQVSQELIDTVITEGSSQCR